MRVLTFFDSAGLMLLPVAVSDDIRRGCAVQQISPLLRSAGGEEEEGRRRGGKKEGSSSRAGPVDGERYFFPRLCIHLMPDRSTARKK